MIKRSLLLSLLLTAGGLQAQDQAPDLSRAKEIAQTICVACHSMDGNSELPDNPKLAGQHPEYLYKQMLDFSGQGDNPPKRKNAIMNPMISPFSNEEMLALAHYYAEQELKPEAATNMETVEQGRQIWRAGIVSKGVPACAACHGPSGAGIPAQYPRISGQFAQYTFQQLKGFRDDIRDNDPAEMMRMIALKMTDKEMQAVADYAAGLR